MSTVQKQIDTAKLSQSYASVDILKSGLYGGGVDLQLPRKIYCLRKNVEWIYNQNPSDSSITGTINYLIALCGKYYLAAGSVTGQSGSTPNNIVPPTTVYLIPIQGSDFTDATHYNDSRIVGKNLAIFWNDINRYLLAGEYAATATGINILIAGFDAIANPTYKLFIYIIN